jgi:hypothetical protein
MTAKAMGVYVLGLGLLACNSQPETSGFPPDEQGSSSGSSTAGGGGGDGGGNGGGSTQASSGQASSGGRTSGSSGGGGSGAGGASAGTSFAGASTASGGSAVDSGSAPRLYDAALTPDADVAQTVTLKTDAFTVAPGDEVYKCETFANPFGQDTDIVWMDGTMSAGSHHFFVFNMDPATEGNRAQPTPLEDCPKGGLEFHPFPYLSQQPHWIVNFPQPNMGYSLRGQNALMLNVHYLNSGSTPIQPGVSITIAIAKPGVVTTHVGNIQLNQIYFSVPVTPVSSPVPESSTWSVSKDVTVFTSWSHMHRTAIDFTASLNGTTFYDEKSWDSPPLYPHNPPIQMKAGDALTWSCSYYNDTGGTLTFGDSAVNNVMCIYFGQYYPADTTNPDILVNE